MTLGGGPDEHPEGPYEGPSGATRFERALLPDARGGLSPVELAHAVNAQTHAALAARARDGSLHRIDPWGELAVPFVYHAPAERVFVLVIPRARAHEELELRAALLTRLSAERAHAMPAYVRAGTTVLGADGLRAHLRAQPGTVTEFAPRPPDPATAWLAAEPAPHAHAATEHGDGFEEAEPVDDDGPDGEPIEPEEVHGDEPGAPPRVVGGRSAAGHAAVVDGEARVWFVGTTRDAELLAMVAPELCAEVDPEGFPLVRVRVRLGPAEAEGAQGSVARAVLDATRPDDREVLDALARGSSLRVELVSEDRRALGTGVARVSDAQGPAIDALVRAVFAREEGDNEARSSRAAAWRDEPDDALITRSLEGALAPTMTRSGVLPATVGSEPAARASRHDP